MKGGLKKLVQRLPDKARMRTAASRHQALSDGIRLRVLWALSEVDLCPCALKQVTGLSDSRLSYHLRILEESGLISSRRTKNWVIYSITKLGSRSLTEFD